MVREECFSLSHDLFAEYYSQDRHNAEADQPSAGDGQQKVRDLHLKYAGREDNELEWSGWGQHGRYHQGQKLLLFEAIADFLQPFLVDSFQQEELTAGPAQTVGQQAAHRGPNRRRYAVDPCLVRSGIGIRCNQSVDRDGNRQAVNDGQNQQSPAPKRLESGDPGTDFEQNFVKRQAAIVREADSGVKITCGSRPCLAFGAAGWRQRGCPLHSFFAAITLAGLPLSGESVLSIEENVL